jgi:hypothetical protein
MMGTKRLSFFFMAVLLAGCSGVQVSQDFDPATAFEGLETFAWASQTQPETGDPRIDNPLRDKRIRAAVERVLANKGFVPADDAPPSFLIRYQSVLRRSFNSTGASPSFGVGVGSVGSRGSIAMGTSTGGAIREVDEGSLIIDFVAPESEALLWRGTGTQIFREHQDPDRTTRDIDTLVERVLAQFPPSVS